MRTSLAILSVAILLAAPSAASAAIEYFAITPGDADRVSIFTHDTVTHAISLADTVTPWAINMSGNSNTHLSAGVDGSFWIGASGGSVEGVNRYVADSPTAPTDWSLDFAINTKNSGPFGDTVNPAGAELANGTFMVGDARSDKFGISTINGAWSGTITAASAGFTGGTYASPIGVSAAIAVDIAPTIAGTTNRFVVTSTGDTTVMVYNSDGTHKGNLTNLTGGTSPMSGVGMMKTSAMGDVALQVGSYQADGPATTVSGYSLADGDFGDELFSFSVPSPSSDQFHWTAVSDVDGMQNGLIMVTGLARTGTSGDVAPTVQFFTTGGTAVTGLIDLTTIDTGMGTTGTGSRPSGVGLQVAPVPEPATLALLAVGGLGLIGRSVRRRTR